MSKETEYIGVVEKLSEKGFSFHKRLLLLSKNRLSYFSSVPPEAETEDFDASKALALGLKQKAFIMTENIISVTPVDEASLKKKKKKHMFVVIFPKEAMNNFSDVGYDPNSKAKPINWTIAIQQTEEYKKWLEALSLTLSTKQLNNKVREEVRETSPIGSTNSLKGEKKLSSRNDIGSRKSLENKSLGAADENVKDDEEADMRIQKENHDPKPTPSIRISRGVSSTSDVEDTALTPLSRNSKRTNSVDKKLIHEVAEKLLSPFTGKKNKQEIKLKNEILKKKNEEEQKLQKEMGAADKMYRKKVLNEILKTSWEAKFNALLDRNAKNVNSLNALMDSEFEILSFMKAFCSKATETCKIIIDELCLPKHLRTHKAIEIATYSEEQEFPEMAFMLNNCIIRVTWTVGGLEKIPQAGEYYLHLGKLLKSYGNEFRAFNLLNDSVYLLNKKQKKALYRVPLSTIIDYKGFRCFVVSNPPINGDETLLIGRLSDGTYKINRTIDEDLKFLGQSVNLKAHKFPLDEKGTSVDALISVRTEIHRVNMSLDEVENSFDESEPPIEGKEVDCYYLMNVSDLVPIDVDIDTNTPQSFLRHLRPEFLSAYEMPLSSDAFHSQYQIPETTRDDTDVITAGRLLRKSSIPSFIAFLESLEILPVNSQSLTNAFHANGVNLRYLGFIAKKTNLSHIKEICTQEMICRSAKKILRKQLCDLIMNESNANSLQNSPIEESNKRSYESLLKKANDEKIEVLLDFLNLMFGTGAESDKFWWGVLSKQILYDFGFQLKKSKKTEMVFGGLLRSIIQHCNIQINLDEELEKNLGTVLNPFKKDHIRGFGLRAKTYNMNKLEINEFESKYKEAFEAKDYNLAIKLCKLMINAERKLQIENRSLKELNYLEDLCDIYLETRELEKAQNLAREVLQDLEPKDLEAIKFLKIIMKIHMMRAQTSLVEELFYEIISYLDFNLGKYHPLHAMIYNMIGYYYVEKGQYDDALVLYRSSLVCLKKILGDNHPQTGEVYSELANLSVKMEKSQEALDYYQKALNVYPQKKEQESAGAANINLEMAKILFSIGNLRDSFATTTKALNYYEKHEEEHTDSLVQCLILAMQVNEIVSDWEKALGFANKVWYLIKNYEIEDFNNAIDKAVVSIFNIFILSQSNEVKSILLDACESLGAVLQQENNLTDELIMKGDINKKLNLYSELVDRNKEGANLYEWFADMFEIISKFLQKKNSHKFFTQDYRDNRLRANNEVLDEALDNFERLLLAFGLDMILKTFNAN